ncbi:MAG: hypothetical protein JXR52_05490 [Bacteroidales bacterium]|nr:hypothetical protein [Bacteroidales bacterium]
MFLKHPPLWPSLSVVLVLMMFAACSGPEPAPSLAGYADVIQFEKFLDPPEAYRSFAFYSLNDRLDTAEIKKQVRAFDEGGLGGFYLHSRSGLLTEYLGSDWWKAMDAGVKTAEETGLHAWFYDEDKWPSGYAGGIIPLKNEMFRAKCLARLDKNTPPPEGSQILLQDDKYSYICYTAALGVPIFNGTCYTDLFNPEAVREFIEVSYKPYLTRYKNYSPERPAGIFTDEPHIHARYFDRRTPSLGTLSWSPSVAEKFKELHDYDLTDSLPLLFEEKNGWRKVRHDYYTTVALQFEESFTKQIADFCAQTGSIFTGHYLGEDALGKVRDRIGNAMLHYRNMQQPGMDHLGLTINGRIITAKSLSSVANQYDRPVRTSEIFGICGQDLGFEDRRWLAGWHVALGVNHFVQHLSAYSLKGARKRDYPPTLSYHQPYWKFNHHLEDYLARISYASTIGKYHPQILVVNPLESEYIKGRADGEFSSELIRLLESLQAAHYDYDLGDEQIMQDRAKVINNRLEIGAMNYEAVILPDMIEIRESTLNQLLAFARNGGQLFNYGRFPVFVNGTAGNTSLAELRQLAVELDSLPVGNQLAGFIKPQVTITGPDSEQVWSQVRTSPEGSLIILANISRTETIQFRISSEYLTDTEVLLWDPSGEQVVKPRGNAETGLEITLPSSSLIWLTAGQLSGNARESEPGFLPAHTEPYLLLENEWQAERLNQNALTLDFAEYSLDGGESFSGSEPVIGIFNRLADKQYNGSLTLRYPFHIDDLPFSCRVVVEQPDMYEEIRVNNQNVTGDWNEHYIDPAFRADDIAGLLATGDNHITLELNFRAPLPDSRDQAERYGTEIESIYLIGDFAVKGTGHSMTRETHRNHAGYLPERPVHAYRDFTIARESPVVKGDLTSEGYPFFAGSFRLSRSFDMASLNESESYFLDISGMEATVCTVTLNGQPVDTLTWAPYLVNITPFIRLGENQLELTITNSLRNLLGPHHHPGADLYRVGPNSFTGAGGFPDPSGNRDWYDLRLDNPDLKLWTDVYYHVPFGFINTVRIVTTHKMPGQQ